MKPILVVIHIYYSELWNELKECLKNITVPYDLYVTTINKNEFLKEDVLSFNPKAHFEIIENRGYDVGPFIHTLKQINLDQYNYLIKLHTKRDIPYSFWAFRGLVKNKWRNYLCSFLSSKEKFDDYLKAFDKNKSLGMQADYHVIVNSDYYDEVASKKVPQWLKNNNYPLIKYSFVAGTMFFSRAEIFKKIQSLNLSLSDFEVVSGDKHRTQLAHIFERLFGYFVYESGYELSDVFTLTNIQKKCYKINKMKERFKQIFRFIYQQKVTSSGYSLVKIFKIPIYRRKI